MDLSSKSFEELQEIAKLNNVHVPHPINRKNLERHVYKNVNIKNVKYRLVIFVKIKLEKDNIIHYSKFLQYIDDNIYQVPSVFLGKIKVDFFTAKYYVKDIYFDSYEVRRIDKDTISVMFERKDPFYKRDSDYIEKLVLETQNSYNINIDNESILYLTKEKLQAYKFPNEFYFDLHFEKISRVAF
jgi:hypothetical protein